MEAAPLKSEVIIQTSKTVEIIDELFFTKNKVNYKIQFGIEQNQDELLIIKLESEKSKNLFYYQHTYRLFDLRKMSKVFTLYETVKDIIYFLKKLNYEIQGYTDDGNGIIILFRLYLPDGQNELVKFNLEKKFSDKNRIINYYLNEMKIIEINILSNQEKIQKEIYELKQKDEKNQIEISKLQKVIKHYKRDRNILFIIMTSLFVIISLIFNNKFTTLKKSLLIDNNINSKENNYENIIPKPPEKINNIFENKKLPGGCIGCTFKNSIDFVLDYVQQNDKYFNFNEMKLLYKSSRDGDDTRICHKLCDNKKNILIIIKSDNNYIFGGYTKIGFKSRTSQNSIDNKSFLFSVNLKKIYPAIKDKNVIGHFDEKRGLTFTGSLYFYDGFMKRYNYISNEIKKYFHGFYHEFEMNGGKKQFIIKELEVYQLF